MACPVRPLLPWLSPKLLAACASVGSVCSLVAHSRPEVLLAIVSFLVSGYYLHRLPVLSKARPLTLALAFPLVWLALYAVLVALYRA